MKKDGKKPEDELQRIRKLNKNSADNNPYPSDRFSEELEEIHARREKKKSASSKSPEIRSSGSGKSQGKKVSASGKSQGKKVSASGKSQGKKVSVSGKSSGKKNVTYKTGNISASEYRVKKSPAKSAIVRHRRKKSPKHSAHSSFGRVKFIFILMILLILFAGVLRMFLSHERLRGYYDRFWLKVTKKTEKLQEAELLATEYDYDAAIETIKSIKGYEDNTELTSCIKEWEETKNNLVAYTASDVTHIFYHTLVIDTELAFECEPSIAEGFKEWMTTIDEFNKITQTMYDEGYVLCSLYDFFDETYDENGTPHFTEKAVYLPKDKKPFILSIDDLSYYHTYTGHGMATKLVLDEAGKITCEYVDRDGNTKTGSYDCVPLINDFMEQHPDGAYRGARGTIALTGYNGVFGYRTDESYVTRDNLSKDKIQWLDENPDYNYDQECADAKAVAEELKAEGWTFASHTWGHIRVGNANLKRIKTDTEKWLKNVEPIIGKTECIIFAHGQDLSSTVNYDTENNKKYKYLASKGFHIFLNVDSYQKTMQVHDLYVHGGRRNLDGYRLWTDAHGESDWTSDLFNAADILDSRRKDMPTPNE